jgi:hypothetical protein
MRKKTFLKGRIVRETQQRREGKLVISGVDQNVEERDQKGSGHEGVIEMVKERPCGNGGVTESTKHRDTRTGDGWEGGDTCVQGRRAR